MTGAQKSLPYSKEGVGLACDTKVAFTIVATLSVYIFQAFTLIQQSCFYCFSLFIFISIHFGICFLFNPF